MVAGPIPTQVAEGGNTAFSWLIVVWCATAFLLAWWFIRNERVYRFRIALINRIHETNRTTPGEWQWRYEEMNAVSYNRMFLTFWKTLRLEAFYAKDPARAER